MNAVRHSPSHSKRFRLRRGTEVTTDARVRLECISCGRAGEVARIVTRRVSGKDGRHPSHLARVRSLTLLGTSSEIVTTPRARRARAPTNQLSPCRTAETCLTLKHEAGAIFAEGLAKVGGRVTGSILKLWLLDLLDEPGLSSEEEAAIWELSETIMRRESITLERVGEA